MLDRIIRDATLSAELLALARSRIELLEARLMRSFSVEDLKALWDSYDGARTSDDVVSGEMVYAELHRRGEGTYCAI